AIGDHDYRVEHFCIVGIVQGSKAVREPPDRVGLAAARRVLNQIGVARSLPPGGTDETAHRVQLVVARKDDPLLDDLLAIWSCLFLLLVVQKLPDDVEKAVALPDLLPQVSGLVPARVLGVAR